MTQSVAWGQLKQQADDAIKPLDPGKYLFLCTKAEHRMASTGSHMIVATLVAQGGAKHGKSLMHNFVFTPDNSFALAMWFRNFDAFGIDGNFFAGLTGDLGNDMPLIANAIVNRQAYATVSIRKYQGQDRNQFDSFEPALGAMVNAAAPGPMTVPGPTAGVVPGVPTMPTPVVPSSPAVPPPPVVPQGPGPQVQAGPPAAPVMQAPVVPAPAQQPATGPLPPDDPF